MLGTSYAIASIALYLGIAVYALTLGPKAVGDYMQDRVMAVCLVAFAMVVDVGAASVLTRSGGGFLQRFLWCVVVTACGIVPVVVIVAVRAILVRQWSGH
jgi:hypothetical protein